MEGTLAAVRSHPPAQSAATPHPPFSQPRLRLVLGGIVLLGLAVRLLHWVAIIQTAWPKHHLMLEYDDFMFFQWAQTILAGDWLGRDPYHPYTKYMQGIAPLETWHQWWGGKEIFHQAPLYAYFLASSLALFGGSVPAVFLLQLLLGSLQPLVMYGLAARLFDARAGLVAAAITALYGPFVFHEATLLRDWLLPLLEPLAILLLLKAHDSGKPHAYGLAGAVLGLVLLAKETALLLIPLMLAWLLLGSNRTWQQRRTAVVWTCLGLLLCLSPLMVRNIHVGAPFYSISNRFAEAFVASNSGQPIESSLAQVLNRSEGRILSTIQATIRLHDDAWMHLANLWRWKFTVLKDPFEIPNNVSYYYGLDISPILRWTLGYDVIFPLGLAGLALALPLWRRHIVMWLYAGSTIGWLMVISPLSRYRLALVPILIVYAAGLVVRLTDLYKERRWREALVVGALVLAGIALQRAVVPLDEASKHHETYLLDYWASARVHAADGQFERAAREMGRLVELSVSLSDRSPLTDQHEADHATYVARQLIQEGNTKQALEVIDRGTLGFLRVAGTPGVASYYPIFNFATLYVKLRERHKAIDALKRFIELAPADPLIPRATQLLDRLQDDPGGPVPPDTDAPGTTRTSPR